MSADRTVALVCDNQGRHGPRVLAELALHDGVTVDVYRRGAGFQRLRQAYGPRAADFDWRCEACGRNPRASAERLTSIVTLLLEHTDEQRIRLNVSHREVARRF